ncbi:TlpA disulfide reductase family protein [Pedobacter sp. L105]|uniref:TlpA disulfide reductase family protein n=1 Tax=Pedobacter sp. L105 TaxID=1641871 RepID=UPI00131A72B4|nr:TlpA disulfide reductase family protein [Pedobacter sp. L105]
MKQFLTGLLILISIHTFSQEKHPSNQFTLSGEVKSPVTNSSFYMLYINEAGVRKLDSAKVIDGRFTFKGMIDGASIGYLSNNFKRMGYDDLHNTQIFLEARDMQITVAGNDIRNVTLTGSPANDEFQVLRKNRARLEKKWANVMDTLTAVNKRSNVAYQEMKNWVLIPYHQDAEELDNNFMKSYPKSYVKAYLVSFDRGSSLDSLKTIYDSFPEIVKNSYYGKAVMEQIAKRKVGVPGAMAAEFSTVDINGKPLKLSDEKGKYVLVDFWASWCVPCRKSNPHLKELYALYKDRGFEIIGVASDDKTPDAWRAAVKKDGLPWKHVLQGLKMGANGILVSDKATDIGYKYNISGLPTQVLVDPAGKIIWRSGVEGNNEGGLDQKLKSVIKN